MTQEKPEGNPMQRIHDDTTDSYCLHCYTPADETEKACAHCRAPFAGSGAYHRVRGPRPSPLFTALFAPDRAASADAWRG